jgi:hypothetical protein
MLLGPQTKNLWNENNFRERTTVCMIQQKKKLILSTARPYVMKHTPLRDQDCGDDMDERLMFTIVANERRFYCPLTGRIMTDPVVIPNGTSFDRNALSDWMEKHGPICPLTGAYLEKVQIKPNFHLQWEILYWQRQQEQVVAASVTTTGSRPAFETKECDIDSSRRPNRDELPPPYHLDSPPTRPRRRGSNGVGVESCEAVPTLPSERRIQSSYQMCKLPQRVPTYLSAYPIYGTDSMMRHEVDPEDDDLSFGQLVSILDEAIMISSGL